MNGLRSDAGAIDNPGAPETAVVYHTITT
jgi:hypothetical protein